MNKEDMPKKTKTIKDLPNDQRPKEKLLKYGAENLADTDEIITRVVNQILSEK